MVSVIIAGGSGTRLWPLSTPECPKHLLKIDGQKRSLLQNTYDRVKAFSKDVYIVTEASHADLVKKQLSSLADENFIVEPARRGTASCIVGSLAYLTSRIDNDEPIAFVAADHYVRDVTGFEHSFKTAADVSASQGRIVLVGVEPDYPATGFGYIKKGEFFDEASLVYSVAEFKEKPKHDLAQKYVSSGNYLWNCSYFVGSVNTFLNSMDSVAKDLSKNYKILRESDNLEHANKLYLDFENQAIDYALIEKVQNLLVVPASFDWMDLGSFADLHKAVDSDEGGNHLHGDVELADVNNSFIQNYGDVPVAVVGLDNVAIVNTKNGILVARKDMSQMVGDVAKKISQKGQNKDK